MSEEDGITRGEMVSLVEFFRRDGVARIKNVWGTIEGHVKQDIMGSVKNVWGDVKGDVSGDVYGRVYGEIKGTSETAKRDIVAKLRDGEKYSDTAGLLLHDAADEIERLRSVITTHMEAMLYLP